MTCKLTKISPNCQRFSPVFSTYFFLPHAILAFDTIFSYLCGQNGTITRYRLRA